MRGRFCLQVLIAAGALFFWAQPVLSQSTAALAQLNGTVQDERGAVITKATITLREMDTKLTDVEFKVGGTAENRAQSLTAFKVGNDRIVHGDDTSATR